MNWQDPAAVATYIGVGGLGLMGVIIKARTWFTRENRDTTYDTEQTKWVEGLQSEIAQLRKDKDNMFAQRLADVVALAEAKAKNEYLSEELTRMRSVLDSMEATVTQLRAKLRAIDSKLADTDRAPL